MTPRNRPSDSRRRVAGVQTGLVAVSRAGTALALRLATVIPSGCAYVPARFLPEADARPSPPSACSYEGPVAQVIAELFTGCEALVLVMAAGAAVRLLAPLLRAKSEDPAVVVVDDAGRFAISLLGGHAAGANALAETVGRLLGATPVLTTATEPAGAPPIETIARERGWRLEPGSALTRVLAALVNGDRVDILQDAGAEDWFDRSASGQELFESVEAMVQAGSPAALIVSDRVHLLPPLLAGRTAVYRPPVLVLGIGCSRGADAAEIAALVEGTLERERLSALAVAAVATIERRRDEPGLRHFAAECGWPLALYSAESLAAVAGDWTRSAIVREAVGTPAVAEPAALAAAGTTQLLVRKVKSTQATLAIARSPVELHIRKGACE